MKRGQVANFFEEIPTGVKVVAGLGAVLTLFLVVRDIVRDSAAAKAARDAAKAAKDELKDWAAAGEKPSYPDSQYSLAADVLYKSFNPSWWVEGGTDEEGVYSIFRQVKNNTDYLKLIAAYGTRDNLSLPAEIRDEMDAEEVQQINSILAAAGVIYKV